MDDTTQQSNSMPSDPTQAAQPMDTTNMNSMSDVAGMTPPPAPIGEAQSEPAPVEPEMPSMPSADPVTANPMPSPVDPMDKSAAGENKDDYSYAEDILNEILDSLDRIEAKLDSMEKKG